MRGDWTPLRVPADDDFVCAGGEEFERADPATGTVVAVTRGSTATDVEAACERARAVADAGEWGTEGALRARVLNGFADALEAEVEALSELLTREQGKTLAESAIEVHASADMARFYAGLARSVYGRSIALGPRAHGVVMRRPLGVVAIVTPWNWPLLLLVRGLAPALAAGNACVVKPASFTSAVIVQALRLLAAQPGLPPGALTCLLGSGATVGDALVGSPQVDMVSFTGDTVTGVRVMRRAAEGVKRVSLELGGKSAQVVFADADPGKAVAGILEGILATSGQVCTAGSRLLVERPLFDELIERLRGAMDSVPIGDGLAEGIELGPLVSPAAAASVRFYVDLGAREGTLVTDPSRGERADVDPSSFVAPALVVDLPTSSRVVREEVFGPVLVAQPFDDEDEAVAAANDSAYGLAAGLWTSDVNRAWRVGSALEAGTVWINTYHHFYPETEVGGVKGSGVGRQQGVDGLLEFTETQHLNFDGAGQLWG